MILIVPMDPEYFPEMVLLLGGAFASAVAVRFLFTRQLGRAARAGAIGVACIALVFVLARLHRGPSRHAVDAQKPTRSPGHR